MLKSQGSKTQTRSARSIRSVGAAIKEQRKQTTREHGQQEMRQRTQRTAQTRKRRKYKRDNALPQITCLFSSGTATPAFSLMFAVPKYYSQMCHHVLLLVYLPPSLLLIHQHPQKMDQPSSGVVVRIHGNFPKCQHRGVYNLKSLEVRVNYLILII